MVVSDKIEEIRRKPEHIRMRYVLISVLAAMFFILIIWIFSVRESFKRLETGTEEDSVDKRGDFFMIKDGVEEKDVTDIIK